MNSSVFEKVLLPAILTSCTVFSVMMVAFTPRRPEPITFDPLDRIEAAEDINHRDSVIRHIGMSIVVSVGAGITTAELLRKWGRWREDGSDGPQIFGAQAMLQAVAMPDLALPADGFTASFNGRTGNTIVSDERTELPKQAVAVLEPDRVSAAEQELPLFLFQRSTPQLTETVDWFSPFSTNDYALADALPEEGLQTAEWQPTEHLVLASREQYKTCRICLADSPQRHLAILFEEQYYRFVKIAATHEQALKITTRLDQRGEPAIITSADERYAVWAFAPEALEVNV